jgi:5-methylcytosine-specific restriction endonuclease McrA
MARYRTFIRSAMRRAWMKWPPKYECLHAARRPYVGPNKKQKWEFQCAHCRDWYMGKEVAVDHIIPWGSLEGLTLDQAWSRLLVGVSQLQVLCTTCHDAKTQLERSVAPSE